MMYVAGAMVPTNRGGGNYYICRRVSKYYCIETGYMKYVAGAMGPTNRGGWEIIIFVERCVNIIVERLVARSM